MNNGQILVELQEFMGSDESIANAAWTSTYDKTKREGKYSDKKKVKDIVTRLIKENHGTPIESVVFRFWIRMPIFIDRQHMTHRIASHNGLSGRYRTMPEDWFPIPVDVNEIMNNATLGIGFDLLQDHYNESCLTATNNYRESINHLKIAEQKGEITNKEFKRVREVIRGQLPTAGMVERTTIMNLRSFANYMRQRNSEHAQPEIRQVAQMMLAAVKKAKVCPVAIKALEEIGWKL